MPKELKKIFDKAVKIVNFIKARALSSRLFHEVCQYIDSDQQQLLLNTEVRWLSRGKVLSMLFKLRNEVNAFLFKWHHHFQLVNVYVTIPG